jgi:sterol desaturase/sphingolipid hydroxylase (fatty acid hydroxylase superfamily)
MDRNCGAFVESGFDFTELSPIPLGEYIYHSNLRTPRWIGYFIQRPEYHSIHHQLDVHGFNYGDITWWDRLFGTFKDADQFASRCGFPENHEKNLGDMLVFHDSY